MCGSRSTRSCTPAKARVSSPTTGSVQSSPRFTASCRASAPAPTRSSFGSRPRAPPRRVGWYRWCALKARSRQSDVVLAPIMRSASMRRLDRVLRVIAGKDVAVSLVGESGAGKEVLARRIHELSHRSRGPFVPINCAAIPEALFESELFGHERGAFTGAHERARGKVEAAEGGTLFLDEIGEIALAMQAKLLRFLENRRFMRVGGTSKIQADVRLLF